MADMKDYKSKEVSERVSIFQKATKEMIATSQNSYNNRYGRWTNSIKEYTKEEIRLYHQNTNY